MKAAWIERFGGHEVIRVNERVMPERKPGELLIRMATATLNHRDIYLRRGEAGRVGLPVVLGSDGAGEVAAADSSSLFTAGDRVAIYPVLACGQSGEHALVLGGSGGVGAFTVLLLKHFGLTVHVATSNLSKRDALLALGADAVLDDNSASVLRHTRGLPEGGVDIAFNWVGGDTWRFLPPAVRTGGRILVCGTLRSPVAELDMRQIFYRNIALIGCSMGTPNALQKFMQLAVKNPSLRVPLFEVISLDEVPDAQRRMEAGKVTGKIAVRIWQPS